MKTKIEVHNVIVTFENNDTITTSINGTKETVKEYYKIGNYFNVGNVSDNMQKITKLQFIK